MKIRHWVMGLVSLAVFVAGGELISAAYSYRGGTEVQVHPVWVDVGGCMVIAAVVPLIGVGMKIAKAMPKTAPRQQPQEPPGQPSPHPTPRQLAEFVSRWMTERQVNGAFKDARLR